MQTRFLPLICLAFMVASCSDHGSVATATAPVDAGHSVDAPPPPAQALALPRTAAADARIGTMLSTAYGDVPIASGGNTFVNAFDWYWLFHQNASYFDPNYNYVVTLQVLWGDPTLAVYGLNSSGWHLIRSSDGRGTSSVQVSYHTSDNAGYTEIWFWVYGNGSAQFSFEMHASPVAAVGGGQNTSSNGNSGNATGGGMLQGVSFLWPLSGSPNDYHWGKWDADWPFGSCGGQWKRHTGLDVIPNSGDIRGRAVVAPTSGTIKVWNGDAGSGWQRFVTVEGSDANGQRFTWTVMHIIPASDQDLAAGRWIERGRYIGYIADLSHDGHTSHLHYMTRRAPYSNISNRGALPKVEDAADRGTGYCDDGKGHRDPLWQADYFMDAGQFGYSTWHWFNGNTAVADH